MPAPENPYDALYQGGRIPTAVSDLTVTNTGATSVTLQWTDRSSFERGFAIERFAAYVHLEPEIPGPFHIIETVGANVTSYTDDGLTRDMTHFYRVVPLGDATRGPVSESIAVTYPYRLIHGPESWQDTTVEISPDGSRIAIGQRSGPLRLFDTATLTMEHSLPQRAAFTFSPDGEHIALGGSEGVAIYRVDSGELERTLRVPSAVASINLVTSLDFSPDGTRLATAGIIHGIRVWDWGRGEEIQSFGSRHPFRFFHNVFFVDSEQVLTSMGGDSVTVWRVADAKAMRTFGPVDAFTTVAYDPNHRQVAITSDDGIRLINVDTGTVLREISGFTGSPISFGDGGNILVAVGSNHVTVISLVAGESTRWFAARPFTYITNASLDASGRYLVAGRRDGSDAGIAAQVWKLDDVWVMRPVP